MKFVTLRFSTQPTKYVIWFPSGLDPSISFLLGFLTPNMLPYFKCMNGFYAICGVFCHKGISGRSKHHNQHPYVCKSTCSLCDAFTLLCPTLKLYILYHISISKYLASLHQVWFTYHGYARRVIKCEISRYYGGSFGLSPNHFTCFFKGFGLPLMVQFVTVTFLGCWALIVPTFVIHFQWNDHPILLNVMAHIKMNTFPF